VSQQHYVSKELTHFVGRTLTSSEERYGLLVKILREGWLTHPPHDRTVSGNLTINLNARVSSNEMYSPQVVCFCDIPIGDLDIHVQKYGPFGIGFPKSVLVARGANPVFYVAKTIERGAAFDHALPEWHRMVEMLHNLLMKTAETPGVPPEAHRLHDLTHFLDFQVFSFIKPFDPHLDDSDHENFYMEREWRVVGNVPFALADVSRVLLPREFGGRLQTDIPEYAGEIDFLG
jgi:hypothetical protein